MINGRFQELLVTSQRYHTAPARLTKCSLATAKSFVEVTPPETQVRLVGILDTICASSNGFALQLDDGAKVRGVVDQGEVAGYRHLFNERVLVQGHAVFRASGRLLRIDAFTVEPADDDSSVWSRVPRPRTRALEAATLRKPQGPRFGLAAVIGKWPGDETDEEVAAALRDVG